MEWKKINQELWLKKLGDQHYEALRWSLSPESGEYFVGWQDVKFSLWFSGDDVDASLEEIKEETMEFYEKEEVTEEEMASYLVEGYSFWNCDERDVVGTHKKAVDFMKKYNKDINELVS